MIQRSVARLEHSITSHPVVLSSDIKKYFSPHDDAVYIRGTVVFTDASSLDLSLFIQKTGRALSVDKYRFHYMDRRGHMVFRYDNAPHHPGLTSFPHHKHVSNRIIAASFKELSDILEEISTIILQ
jgi:hypothetical protein